MTKLPTGPYCYLGFTYDEVHEPIHRENLGYDQNDPYPNGRNRAPDSLHRPTYGDNYQWEAKSIAPNTAELRKQSPPYFRLGNIYMVGPTPLIDNTDSYYSQRSRVSAIIDPELNNGADTAIALILPDGTLRLHPEWGRGWGLHPRFDYEIADTQFLARRWKGCTQKVLANCYEAGQLELPFIAGTPITQESTATINVSDEPTEETERRAEEEEQRRAEEAERRAAKEQQPDTEDDTG